MHTTLYNYPWERQVVTYPYVWWDAPFTPEELDQVTKYCIAAGVEPGTTVGAVDLEDAKKVRRSGVKFHKRNDDTAWIFDKLNHILLGLNNQYYGFVLNGYDAFQYTEYHAAEEGKYGWHLDMCLDAQVPATMIEPRKLSMTLLLTDPSEFTGGDFQVNLGNQDHAKTVEFKKGRAVCFPSWLAHQVTPVISGCRRSIVVWVTGPKFV